MLCFVINLLLYKVGMCVLKNWKPIELILYFGGISIIVLCFVLFKAKNYLSLVSSIIGITAVISVAKGLVITPIVGLIYNVFYIIISYIQKYYGEAIIYFFIMTPIYIYSIVDWFKNKQEDKTAVVKINKIGWKEYLYLSIATIVATVGFYFLLRELGTAQLIISTISLITSAVASYLMLRRSSNYAIGFILNDVILIVLWSMSVVTYGIGYLPSVISFCVFLMNDTYGFINWKIEERRQQSIVSTDNKKIKKDN